MAVRKTPCLCKDCKFSRLIQYANDPIIAECTLTGDRQVSSTPIFCNRFRKGNIEAVVEHRKKRMGIGDNFIS